MLHGTRKLYPELTMYAGNSQNMRREKDEIILMCRDKQTLVRMNSRPLWDRCHFNVSMFTLRAVRMFSWVAHITMG